MLKRPSTDEELQKREAVGIIRASHFVRKYAHSHKPITVKTICEIHKKIFQDAWPEIAGEYRFENIKITDSHHLPPHHTEIPALMKKLDDDLAIKLKELEGCEGIILDMQSVDDTILECIDKIIKVAAWVHHSITHIHPFREGNGRTARLVANLVLERYGLVGISIKIEKENKNSYRKALAQIDKENDYEPLINLIYEGLYERYNGVRVKYYDVKNK